MNFVGTFFRKGNTNTFTAKASLKVPDLLFLCTAVLCNYLVLAPLHSLFIHSPLHQGRKEGLPRRSENEGRKKTLHELPNTEIVKSWSIRRLVLGQYTYMYSVGGVKKKYIFRFLNF